VEHNGFWPNRHNRGKIKIGGELERRSKMRRGWLEHRSVITPCKARNMADWGGGRS